MEEELFTVENLRCPNCLKIFGTPSEQASALEIYKKCITCLKELERLTGKQQYNVEVLLDNYYRTIGK